MNQEQTIVFNGLMGGETNIVSTWLDTENEDQQKICNYIMNNYEDWALIKPMYNSKLDWMVTYICKTPDNFKVAVTTGMPDSIYYCKQDEAKLLVLASQN